MADNEDDGVKAITTLLDTLRPLDPETRANVLEYVFKTLGISAPSPSAPTMLSMPPGAPPPPTPIVHHQLGGVQNLRTLTEQKDPKTVNQMVAVMAYYLSEYAPQEERRDFIVADDIKKYFRQANFPLPTGRPGMTLVNAKNAGYLDALNNGQYRLNPVGHNLVVHRLPKSESTPARTSRRNKGAKKEAKKARR